MTFGYKSLVNKLIKSTPLIRLRHAGFTAGHFLLPLLWSFSAQASIQLGMTTALEGPSKELGQHVLEGYELYFKHVEKQLEAINQTVEIIALNDNYEPKIAAKNMQTLAKNRDILAVVGNVGTPTALVTSPVANKHKILMFGSITGADILRKSPLPDRYIINYRASYRQETAAIVKSLVDNGIDPKRIALFTQRDGYGDAGFVGALSALSAYQVGADQLHSHGRYQRNTLNVEEALVELIDSEQDPQAVIMVGAYGPVAKYIKLAKEEFSNLLFINLSFVGSIPLLESLGEQAENVIVTQVVPHFDAELPISQEYRAALSSNGANHSPSFLGFEGFISAKILHQAIKRVEHKALSRERLVDELESLGEFDIGLGVKLNLSPKNHQASQTVWPTIIRDGRYQSLQWSEISELIR